MADLAARLEGRVAELTAAVVADILRAEPAYQDSPELPVEELHSSVLGSLSQQIRKLVNPAAETYGYLTLLTEIGRRRVEQGVPLESLLHAFRIGARAIWDGLREEAQRAEGIEPIGGTVLAEAATAIWELHEAVSARVATAYRDAELVSLRRRDRERAALIDGLLEGRGQETTYARDAAFALRLRLSGRYIVVVAEAMASGAEPLPDVERALAANGYSSVWRITPHRTLGIVDLGAADIRPLRTLLESINGGRVGVSTVVDSLAELAHAHRLAETALASVPPLRCEVGVLADRLPAALLAASPHVAAVLVQQTLGPLFDVADEECDLLLETVEAYIECGLSAKETAARIHCHRNTVLKRLRRFEELTRRPLTDPSTLLSVALALRAVSLLSGRPESRSTA